MVTTEVSSQSWFGRIRESIKSFLFGLAMFAAAFPVLWLNEGRAVKTEKSLKEGAGAVVTVPADKVQPANDHKLVHLTGKAATEETLADADFGVSANAVKLRRNVEMYQWEESKDTKTEKKVGGGSETRTTYSYNKKWSDSAIDSSSFKEASDHQNPGALPYDSKEQTANHVTLGAFTLNPALVGMMSDFDPIPVDDKTLEKLSADLKSKLKVDKGSFYQGADPANPAIGDTRITFAAVLPTDVSVVSQQAGASFEPYKASAGMDIEMLKRGVHTAKDMFDSALAANTMLTWILRVVGFILMFVGLVLFFRPLSVLGDLIPFIGSMLAFGTGLFAFAISAALSVGTIGVAWIVYRPVLGIILVGAALAGVVMLALRGKKKAALTSGQQTATA